MPYTSCQYAPPDIVADAQARVKGVDERITCTDDQGQVWWLTEDSQVGDWLRFKEEGGTVLEAPPPPVPDPEVDPTTRTFPIGPIPIRSVEFVEGNTGIIVLLEAGPLLRFLFEHDRLRIEATGDARLNREIIIDDVNRYPDGAVSFFISGIDLDRDIKGKGRVTILAGG